MCSSTALRIFMTFSSGGASAVLEESLARKNKRSLNATQDTTKDRPPRPRFDQSYSIVGPDGQPLLYTVGGEKVGVGGTGAAPKTLTYAERRTLRGSPFSDAERSTNVAPATFFNGGSTLSLYPDDAPGGLLTRY